MLERYRFRGGFPTPETIDQAYNDADLVRAIEAFKFFYPTVAIASAWKAGLRTGVMPNKAFLLERGCPSPIVLTPNSDMPYVGASIDLSEGPIAVELPPGPLICAVTDLHQRRVMEMGLAGPDVAAGGRHIIVPPDHDGELPADCHTGRSSTQRAVLTLRALPPQGDMDASLALLKAVKIYPLARPESGEPPRQIDMGYGFDDAAITDEDDGTTFWQELHEVLLLEPPLELHRIQYGQLASLGIEKGESFAPDERMAEILRRAGKIALAQMRVEAFADRRPDRIPWSNRRWEWAGQRPGIGITELPSHRDVEEGERFFYEGASETACLLRRDPGIGSLHWLGTRDAAGGYLDGARNYRLMVPLPVPAKLFWSITVYDGATCSEIVTPQGKAALASLVDFPNIRGSRLHLHFGPIPPADGESRWIQTLPDKGWFAFFRIYRPDRAAFDRSWRPGDFECVG